MLKIGNNGQCRRFMFFENYIIENSMKIENLKL